MAEDDRLRHELDDLKGAELSKVELGAGEIFVEFKKPDRTWSLGTGGSQWRLFHGKDIVVSDEHGESEIARFERAKGRQVVGFDFPYEPSALRVDLGNAFVFWILRSEDGIAAELPVFELATPAHGTFIVYDDGVDEVDDDVPIPSLLKTGFLRRWPSDDSSEDLAAG
jgi:hypothetical protein